MQIFVLLWKTTQSEVEKRLATGEERDTMTAIDGYFSAGERLRTSCINHALKEPGGPRAERHRENRGL
jgi:hypothetical protein